MTASIYIAHASKYIHYNTIQFIHNQIINAASIWKGLFYLNRSGHGILLVYGERWHIYVYGEIINKNSLYRDI